MFELFKLLICDSIVFIAFHFFLFFTLLYAVIKVSLGKRRFEKGDSGVEATVIRGDPSWNSLQLTYGIASVLIIQLISVSESFKGFKVAISIVDLSALFYLFFYNGWFRNKVIGIVSKSKTMDEIF